MKRKSVFAAGIILKLLAILFILVFWWTLGYEIAEEVTSVNDFLYNKADRIESCDHYYYRQDYGGLREELSVYGLDEPEFDKYREAVKGFEDYQMYLQYKKAAEAGLPDAAEKAEQYRLQVIENAENCEDQGNQKRLSQYVQMAE